MDELVNFDFDVDPAIGSGSKRQGSAELGS
jgi:hypothetical protein